MPKKGAGFPALPFKLGDQPAWFKDSRTPGSTSFKGGKKPQVKKGK